MEIQEQSPLPPNSNAQNPVVISDIENGTDNKRIQFTLIFTARFAYPEIIKEPYSHESTGWISFPLTESGFQQFDEVSRFLIGKKLLPKANELEDLRVLDHMINNKIEVNDDLSSYILNSHGLIFRRIILAKLVGNVLYEDICNYHRQFFPQYRSSANEKRFEYLKNYPIVFEEVYYHVKSFPLDLANAR